MIYTSEAGSQARQAQYTPEFSVDARTEVTQVGERTVNIEEIITPAGGGTVEAELKAPTVISISLQLKARRFDIQLLLDRKRNNYLLLPRLIAIKLLVGMITIYVNHSVSELVNGKAGLYLPLQGWLIWLEA